MTIIPDLCRAYDAITGFIARIPHLHIQWVLQSMSRKLSISSRKFKRVGGVTEVELFSAIPKKYWRLDDDMVAKEGAKVPADNPIFTHC